MQTLSVADTLRSAMERRAPLRPILEAFQPLTELRASVPAALLEAVEQSGFRLPAWDDARGQNGEPLLFGAVPEALGSLGRPLQVAASFFTPVFAELPFLKPYGAALSALAKDGEALLTAARAFFEGDADTLEALAEVRALPSGVLSMVLEAVCGAVLRAAVKLQYPENAEWAAPWDERPASWGRGWCPVCGSAPVVAWMEEKGFDHKNPFAAGGGGRKHLHCGLCGTEWRFRRGACPSCDSEGADAMEILRESEDSRGERVDWCTRCKTYCPAVDLRERDTRPDMDALALTLMHLDMVAAEKGLKPLYPTFWNQH